MTRRDTLRAAVLSVFAMAMQKLDVAAIEGGVLTVKMDDWRWLAFEYQGKQVTIPASEVFAALDEAYGSTTVRR